MKGTVDTKVVRIGNSRGVRIPKPLLEEAGIEGNVRLRVTEEGILIEASHLVRQGWGEAADGMVATSEGGLLDEAQPTDWDELEWVWE